MSTSDPDTGTPSIRTRVSVAEFDSLPDADAYTMLAACCGTRAWVQRMMGRRPFTSPAVLLQTADEIWMSLSPADWREAFDHHPRIGQQHASVHASLSAATWSKSEQSAAATSPGAIRTALAEGQQEYEKRFGHIFLVCASGRTSEELLGNLRERLGNSAAVELRVAALEQMKITRLRLERLLGIEQERLS